MDDTTMYRPTISERDLRDMIINIMNDSRLRKLEEENNKLREKMEILVGVPFNIGQSVYFVYETQKDNFVIDEGNIISFCIDNMGIWIYCRYKSGLTYWHKKEEVSECLFPTRAAAEKRLAELKGEKSNERL